MAVEATVCGMAIYKGESWTWERQGGLSRARGKNHWIRAHLLTMNGECASSVKRCASSARTLVSSGEIHREAQRTNDGISAPRRQIFGPSSLVAADIVVSRCWDILATGRSPVASQALAQAT